MPGAHELDPARGPKPLPCALNAPSYMCDATDFWRKIPCLTIDVDSLYINILHKDGLEAIGNMVSDSATAALATKLCQFVLTLNSFRPGNSLCLQMNGYSLMSPWG